MTERLASGQPPCAALAGTAKYLLAIETTCDETAVAVVDQAGHVLSSVVCSQDQLHQRYHGVVPEIAARAHLERILPALHEALQTAGLALAQVDFFAVANTPGLAGSLLVGLCAAKALALAMGKPLVAVNHLQAHIYACQMGARRQIYPCVGLIASGGHSSLYRCESPLACDLIGSTIDDAAGEAFDKVAALLGLPYPGGPAIEQAAKAGNPRAFRFPRALLEEADNLDFSFSGLKTAVRYAICKPGQPMPEPLSAQSVANLAASFQQAAVDVLVQKALRAIRITGFNRLAAAGGVAANGLLRASLAEAAAAQNVELFIAPRKWCTDNAVMAAIAWEKYRLGQFDALDVDSQPGLIRKDR